MNKSDQDRLEKIEEALADLAKQAEPLKRERDQIRNRIRVRRHRSK